MSNIPGRARFHRLAITSAVDSGSSGERGELAEGMMPWAVHT